MLWANAVKIWNQHKKSVNAAHVYCLPRKGTPEHAHVKHIQSGGDPAKFKHGTSDKEHDELISEMDALLEKGKVAPKKFVFKNKAKETAAKEARVAETGKKMKGEKVKAFLKAALERRRAKKEVGARVKELPEDVEGIIKKMVGDPNKEKVMERFKTQMKGLKKFIAHLEEDIRNRHNQITRETNMIEIDFAYREAPEFIRDIVDVILESKGAGNGEIRYGDLETWIEILENIHEAGQAVLKGQDKWTTLFEAEEVNPIWGPDIGMSDLDGLEHVFALRFFINNEINEIRDDEDEEEEEYDDDLPYDYLLEGHFATYEWMKEDDVRQKRHEREQALGRLEYHLRDTLRKAKVSKFLKAALERRRAKKAAAAPKPVKAPPKPGPRPADPLEGHTTKATALLITSLEGLKPIFPHASAETLAKRFDFKKHPKGYLLHRAKGGSIVANPV